jgi:hypothetical protein
MAGPRSVLAVLTVLALSALPSFYADVPAQGARPVAPPRRPPFGIE